MIASLLGGVLLREVPEALLVGVKSGQYSVYGSIIKSVSNGQIVGHLQEAGGLSKLAGMFGSGPLGLLAGGVQMVQNEQIKSGIGRLEAGMGMLQSLGVANLALGAAGICGQSRSPLRRLCAGALEKARDLSHPPSSRGCIREESARSNCNRVDGTSRRYCFVRCPGDGCDEITARREAWKQLYLQQGSLCHPAMANARTW